MKTLFLTTGIYAEFKISHNLPERLTERIGEILDDLEDEFPELKSGSCHVEFQVSLSTKKLKR